MLSGGALRIPHLAYLFYCLAVLAVVNFREHPFSEVGE
jgi:hypothetical protein